MTVLEALAILEAAVLECKKRDINTPEVKEALDSLERYIWPKWLIAQFRHHALKERTDNDVEGQQQVLLLEADKTLIQCPRQQGENEAVESEKCLSVTLSFEGETESKIGDFLLAVVQRQTPTIRGAACRKQHDQ